MSDKDNTNMDRPPIPSSPSSYRAILPLLMASFASMGESGMFSGLMGGPRNKERIAQQREARRKKSRKIRNKRKALRIARRRNR